MTLSFYSVSQQQYDALLAQLKAKPDAEGVISGETPLGVLKCQVRYNEPSGYLTVVVIEKPAFLSFETIRHQIATRLNEAAATPPVATPTTESIAPEGATAPDGEAETQD